MPKYHIHIGDKGYLLEGGPDPESVSSLANPVAPRTSAEGFYQELALSNWRAGVGNPNPEDQGSLYSEAETRFDGRLMLPGLVSSLAFTPTAGADAKAHFTETCDELYLAFGQVVYEIINNTLVPLHTAASDISDLHYFDGHLFIGQGFSSVFEWYDLSDDSTGVGPYPANLFYEYAGLLYISGENWVRYTAGSLTDCTTPTPNPTTDSCAVSQDPTQPWCWSEEIAFGPCEPCCWITGMLGVIDGPLNSQILLVSTCRKLFAILPGDTPVHVEDWPSIDEVNGSNITAFNGSAYIPVGHGMKRRTVTGDLIEMGIDLREGLPCTKSGKHVDVAAMENWVLSLVSGQVNSVWAYSGEGWHYIATVSGDNSALHYSQQENRLYVAGDGVLSWVDTPDTSDNPQKAGTTFAAAGYVDMGWFRGDFPTLQKDWYAVHVTGECITPTTPVEIYYRLWDPSSPECEICEEVAEESWTLLGTATTNETLVAWPCVEQRPAGKGLRLRVNLKTTDSSKTPVVQDIRLRYLTHFTDSWRWSFQVGLPHDCMFDACRTQIEDYDQQEWDENLCEAASSVGPIPFTDLDGSSYHVKVLDAARRVHSVLYEADTPTFDIEWAISIQQVCPDSISC